MTVRGHVEIAGAGIVGLTAASLLAQRGWSVRVHERHAELREIGAGLTLWANGLHVLREIGAFEEAEVGGGWIKRWSLLDERNRTLQEANIEACTFLRTHLHRVLADKALKHGVEIVTSSPVTGATSDGHLLLEDGSKLKADVVIGADGVNSRVRDSLGLANSVKGLKDGCVRALVPVRPGDVQDHFIEHWSGSRRIGLVPCTDEFFYIYGCCSADDTDAHRYPSVWAETFPQYSDLIERITGFPGYNEYHEVRAKSWSSGRVAIVGDAANAMSANLGLAANLGIVNAYSLTQAIDEFSDIPTGLQKWEASERSFTDSAQRYARYYSRVVTRWPVPLLDARSALIWGLGFSSTVQNRLRVHPAVRRVPHLLPERSAARTD